MQNGATVLVTGARVTKGGAAFADAEMAFAGGKWDTFRMLTHPGTSIIPGALVAAEATGRLGQRLHHRHRGGLRGDGAHGRRLHPDGDGARLPRRPGVRHLRRRPSPPRRCCASTADQVNSTIALCASLAAGNLEGARSGGSRAARGRGGPQRVAGGGAGQPGHAGGETVLEGEAGFYHAYAGNNQGRLTYSFAGDTQTSLDKITAGLGRDWLFLETLYRIYSTAGYNIAHVDVTARLCEEHDIRPSRRRPRRGGGELARDPVPEPGVPESPGRHWSRGVGSTRVLHGVRRRRARLPGAAGLEQRAGRRSARGARPHEARDAHPLASDGRCSGRASRSTRRTARATRGRPPAASSSGTSTRRRGAFAAWSPGCRSRPRSSKR